MKKPEPAPMQGQPGIYLLKLYVANGETNSELARENLRSICAEYLDDNCSIEFIDVLQDYAAAIEDRIFVTPALVLLSPQPRATVIGNLSDRERVISALRLKEHHAIKPSQDARKAL